MSDIFREVDDALQQEKLLKFWNDNKSTLIAALVLLLVGTTIGTIYKNWDAGRNATETARLSEALESKDPQAAIAEVVKDTRKGHKVIGLMTAANLNLQNGKKAEAATIYKQIVDDKSSPRNMRDLARILFVQNTDKADASILKPLLSDEKSPWIWQARVEAAVIAAHTDKDYAKAIEYLKPFENSQYVPYSLKQRAEALKHVYTLKQQEQKPAAPTEN